MISQISEILHRLFLLSIVSISFLSNPYIAQAEEPKSSQIDSFIEQGIKFYSEMQYEKAKSCFEDADKLNPKVRYKRFISYALKTMDDLGPLLNEIGTLNNQLKAAGSDEKPGLIEKLKLCHLNMGRRLLEEGGYIAIIKAHFDYVISQDPLNAEAQYYLGDVNYSGMLYEEAVKNYKKLIEVYPDNPFFQQRLGDIYVGTGIYDDAKQYYEKAISLFEKIGAEDKDEKIDYLKRLIGKLPTSLGDIQGLMKQKEYQTVIALCKKRAVMNPSDITAITWMGIAYGELGDWRQAEGLYKNAIKRNPEYPTPYYYLGMIYLNQRKDTARAIREIDAFEKKSEDLLEIDKNAKELIIAARHALVHIYHEILRDYKKATQESKLLIELAPNDQAAHYNLALSYLYLDKKSMAYEEFKKVMGINPSTKLGYLARDAIEDMQKYSSVRTLPYSSRDE